MYANLDVLKKYFIRMFGYLVFSFLPLFHHQDFPQGMPTE
jgi:hypothetical protein